MDNMSSSGLQNHPFNALQQAAYQLSSCTDQLFRQIDQEQIISATIDRIRSSLELQDIFKTTVTEIRKFLQVDRVAVFRFDPDSGFDEGEFVAEDVGEGIDSALAAKVYDHCFGKQFAAHYYQGRVQAVADIYDANLSDCHIKILSQFQVRANLIVPVLKGDTLWGLLCVHQCSGPRRWQLPEIEFVRKIGTQFAIALQQAEYLELRQQQSSLLAQTKAQEKALSRQKALVKITNRIRQALDFTEICQTATAEVRQLLKADRVTIYRFNPDWSGDFLFESVGPDWNPLVGVSPTIEDTHLMENQGGRYANNETFAIPDIYTAGHSDCHVALLEQFQARAYAIAPIFEEDRLWGLLTAFQNAGPREWQADEVELLAQIGEQLGIALKQAEFVRQMQVQTIERQELVEDLQRQEAWLRFLVTGTASATGTDFLKACARTLSQALDMPYVLISKCLDYPPTRVETFCFWAKNDYAENFAYDLAGTPCQNVLDREGTELSVCRHARNVQALFPEDADLVALQAESYLGVPILDQSARVLGNIAVLDTRPLSDKAALHQSDILKIYATRIGAELERVAAETALNNKATELESTLAELHRAQMQLVQTEKMSSLGQLVAGVAHEINNPVGFIHGNLNHVEAYVNDLLGLIRLYREAYSEPERHIQEVEEEIDFDFLKTDLPKTLTSMKGGTDRIQDIIKSLRMFSRLDEAAVKAVDLHEGIDSTLVILGNRLKANGSHVAIEVVKNYGDLPLVECYAGQLNQVFMNILGNAIDALESRRLNASEADAAPAITITTRPLKAEEIEIRIADNGPGVPEDVQPRLFDPFFTTKPVGKGTGMGLSISYQVITETHQGTLRVTSSQAEADRGTTFIITLPTVLAPAAPTATAGSL
jgi:GAF domain-containing protein